MNSFPEKVYLNGKIINSEDAKISVFDRGFLFGDGVYEVMLKINSQFFYGKEHLQRLVNSLQKIHLDFDSSTLQNKIYELIGTSNLTQDDCLIYIQITRGIAPRKHAFPIDTKPTLMMYAMPFKLPEINSTNYKIITMPDFRWHRCDIKMTSLLGNVIANNTAIKQGNQEAVFIRDGFITEGSHSTVFFVKDSIIYTHPNNELILDGITRQIVFQLCKDLKIPIIEKAISEKEITIMHEAFLTGTTTQIAAIKQINDYCFYINNEIGPITKRLQKAFLKLKKLTN